MNHISLIIPAYKPDEKLLSVIDDALGVGFSDIIVVDDGSGAPFAEIFERVAAHSECTLLRHPANKGKGAALRTAFSYALENRPDGIGVVTADADGQHKIDDILAAAEKMKKTGKVVLGCRDFSAPEVPPRSKFGNLCTRTVFKLFFGMTVTDTQTGLRAFPQSVLSDFVKVKGDRYEYETNMLLYMSRESIPFTEVTVDTVYIDDNASSHFRVIRDSIRIYGLIVKYLCSSAAAMIIDNGVFFLLKQFPLISIPFLPQTFLATFLARVVSSFVNYSVNARAVFGEKTSKKTLLRYYTLAVCQMTVSAVVLFAIEKILFVNFAAISTLLKMLVDTILFFACFRLQHRWVFNAK